MRRLLIACVAVAAWASCERARQDDTPASCESRGGIWMCGCLPGCCGYSCNERAADAGKVCSDYTECAGTCEATGGFGGVGFGGDGFGGPSDGYGGGRVGRCCDHEVCFPRYVVVEGRVYPGGIP